MRRLEPAEHVQHQLELRLGDIGTDEHTPMCRGDVLNFEVVADPLQMLAHRAHLLGAAKPSKLREQVVFDPG